MRVNSQKSDGSTSTEEEIAHPPGTVVLFRSGAKSDANVSDSLGADAGAASHKLIQMDSHFLVVRKLPLHPVPVAKVDVRNSNTSLLLPLGSSYQYVHREKETHKNPLRFFKSFSDSWK